MNEQEPKLENGERDQPSVGEVITLLQGLREQGIDFVDEDIAHLQEMELDEAIGYAFDTLLEIGVEDPEAILIEKGDFTKTSVK